MTTGTDQYGRPLRAVVSVRRNFYGAPIELLDCGHDLLGLIRDNGIWRGHTRRPRRRCEHCADEQTIIETIRRRSVRWRRRHDGTVAVFRWHYERHNGRQWCGWRSWSEPYDDQRPAITWEQAGAGS